MQLALVMLCARISGVHVNIHLADVHFIRAASRAFSIALFMHFSHYKIQSNAKQSHKLDDFPTPTRWHTNETKFSISMN